MEAQARRPRSIFMIVSWMILAVCFALFVSYMAVHAADLLDSDMASEMVLSKQLSQSGKVFSNQWYYSTELRVVNTQLVYAFFFHFTDDWQLVRILGNVFLATALLASYYFLCRKLKIERYFPLTAAVMLLPLSAHYFYILLYGAYYIPRISMMFLILGILLPFDQTQSTRAVRAVSCLSACALSFVLGLEGARMLLILCVPVAILVFAESVQQLLSYRRQIIKPYPGFFSYLNQTGFLDYLGQAFLACLLAVFGYGFNALILSERYSFEHVDLAFGLSFENVKRTLFNQLYVFGDSLSLKILSCAAWALIGILFLRFLFSKNEKSLVSKRFIWFCIIAAGCFSAFGFAFPIGLVSWHFVPVAILFIPAIALILKKNHVQRPLKQIACGLLSVIVLFFGVQGYVAFENWPYREGTRCNDEFAQIAGVLETERFDSGYATFWNANVLTELTDGKIDVWCVNSFDDQTARTPDLYLWLQDKSHEQTLPGGKTFVIWSREEYGLYHDRDFAYLCEELYRSENYVVYEIRP